jgi:hypothetical protein
MQIQHPELYQQLAMSWNKLYPGFMSATKDADVYDTFGGSYPTNPMADSRSGTIRGSYNPPPLPTNPTNFDVSNENKQSNLQGAREAVKKTVSWGTSMLQMVNINAIQPVVQSGLGFLSAEERVQPKNVVQGNYQAVAMNDDEDSMGQSSMFLGGPGPSSEDLSL